MTKTEYRILCYDIAAPDGPSAQYTFANRKEALSEAKRLDSTSWHRVEVQRLTIETISSHEKTDKAIKSIIDTGKAAWEQHLKEGGVLALNLEKRP